MNVAVIDQLVGAALQVAVVVLIAAGVWLIFGRKRANFGAYVGLHRTTARAIGAAVIFAVAPALMLLVPQFREIASGPNTLVAQVVAQLGHSTTGIAVLLVIAVFKTAFAEELLFRGLIGKRLIAWLGFTTGNIIQALLFGSIHLFIFPNPMAGGALFAGASATLLGWVNGWMNERLGNGSILPGWITHGLGNAITYVAIALFVL